MDKLKMHSPDLIAANIRRLAELFPGCTPGSSFATLIASSRPRTCGTRWWTASRN